MSNTKEEVEKIKSYFNPEICYYSPEFLKDFKEDLKLRIKEELGIDVEV